MARVATLTDPGNRPGANEDAVGSVGEDGPWFVADGAGGYAGGRLASEIVAKTILELGGRGELEAVIFRAHEAIVEYSRAHPECAEMRSTVVAGQFSGGYCHVVWVGDSRAYLWRRQRLRRLTRDHSYVEELREQQHLSATQVREHPNRNLVTRMLGFETPVPSVVDERMRRGDWIVLCSDGLNGELTDKEIGGILEMSSAPDAAARALIDAAVLHGGRDNVSVVVVDYGDRGTTSRWWPDSRAALLSILGGSAVVLAVCGWWSWKRLR